MKGILITDSVECKVLGIDPTQSRSSSDQQNHLTNQLNQNLQETLVKISRQYNYLNVKLCTMKYTPFKPKTKKSEQNWNKTNPDSIKK